MKDDHSLKINYTYKLTISCHGGLIHTNLKVLTTAHLTQKHPLLPT